MSLIIDVSINEDAILLVAAQRVSNTGQNTLDPDADSVYRVTSAERTRNGRDYGPTRDHGFIIHRYGDGAAVLAEKALACVNDS